MLMAINGKSRLSQLKIEETHNTPLILLDNQNGNFVFSGNSFPENSTSFYEPVMQWLDLYEKQPNTKLIIDFMMDYINSSSAHMIFRIIKRIENITQKGCKAIVRWYYCGDDDDMYEEGLGYAEKVSIPFEFYEYED